MGKFYGVYGKNGLGVFDNYFIAYDKRQYIDGIRIKRFNTKEEAVQYCVEGYNSLQDHYVPDNLVSEKMILRTSLNWITYSKKIRANNNEQLKNMVRIVE